MDLRRQLNNEECNDEQRKDDTQSCASRDPQGRFVDEVEVSDMSGEDDSIGTVLGRVLKNTQASRKAEKDTTNQQMTSFAGIIAESFARAQKAAASPTLTSP